MAKDSNASWVPSSDNSGFGLANLPYGVVRRSGGSVRPVVRIGSYVLDLRELVEIGMLSDPALPSDVFAGPTLNPFLALGRGAWESVRKRIVELLGANNRELQDAGVVERVLAPLSDVETVLPVKIGDYVDFYSSLEHATNLGRMFRPGGKPLLPNWRYLPVGYHGRASSVVVSGTPIRRPVGQLPGLNRDGPPNFGPTEKLDIELEIGFITGPGNELGTRLPITAASEHIFGVVLVNDWSARDIQRWEYQPLGPFLGKSFGTSISPWIVTLEALAPFRVPSPKQEPAPFEYLHSDEEWGLDIDLEIALIPAGGEDETVISSTNAQGLYWNIAQQLAHASINGTNINPGDLYASGTISGSEPGSQGSLIELTQGGRNPIELQSGEQRLFLQDGDRVILRGSSGRGDQRVIFAEVTGVIEPAL